MTQYEQHLMQLRFQIPGKLSKISSLFIYDRNWSNELTFLSALNGSKSNSHNSIIKFRHTSLPSTERKNVFSQTPSKATTLSCFYRGWFGQPIVHSLKYQKRRRKIGQRFYAAACFTSYFVSCFPIFKEMEKTRPHEILHGRVLSYAATSSGSCKMILQNDFEP